MKWLLVFFTMLLINNTLAMSCDDSFKNQREDASPESHQPQEQVLEKDVNYGIYGTFRKGTSLETINRAINHVNVRMGRRVDRDLLW